MINYLGRHYENISDARIKKDKNRNCKTLKPISRVVYVR